LSAVSWKIPETCSYPSFFATLAKKLYLVRACDSPAKAARRLFSVWLPFRSMGINA
jgi:hypothetical protein